VHAQNDNVDGVSNSLSYYDEQKKRRPVESISMRTEARVRIEAHEGSDHGLPRLVEAWTPDDTDAFE
jgi:hypothetical protein